jgi:hypothetical protein
LIVSGHVINIEEPEEYNRIVGKIPVPGRKRTVAAARLPRGQRLYHGNEGLTKMRVRKTASIPPGATLPA